MRSYPQYLFVFLMLLLGTSACTSPEAENTQAVVQPTADDPARWEGEIAALEEATNANPPKDAFLFIGSSSIRLWDTLAEDMAPLPVIKHGFGGSKLGDAIHYIDRLITPYNPRAVVMFSGTNDIAGDNPKQPEEVFTLYKAFVSEVHQRMPGLPIYFIAITPTHSRLEHIDLVNRTNAMVAQHVIDHPNLFYIDTASAVLGPDGLPRPELFREDQLHLNADGYAIWASVIKPVLVASVQPEMAMLP